MTTLPLNRSVSVIYADDIRQEVAGKFTIIGIYQGKMLFPRFPAVIPKLAIFVTATSAAASPFKSLTVRIHKGDDLLFETTLAEAQIKSVNASGTNQDAARSTGIDAIFSIVTGPFEITERCEIRTEVLTEDGILPAKNLIIDTAQALASDITQPAV